MGKYFVNDWVETKYGVGQIKKIWVLNKQVTVFEVKHFREEKVRNVFYPEIIRVFNK